MLVFIHEFLVPEIFKTQPTNQNVKVSGVNFLTKIKKLVQFSATRFWYQILEHV